jgi:hypothetical protein
MLHNAFLLTLWSGGIRYVRPFLGGMAAPGSVFWSTSLAKMREEARLVLKGSRSEVLLFFRPNTGGV